MKITRRGTARDHGPAMIELTNTTFSYDPSDGMIHIKARNVADFRAEATHNYDVTLTLQDLKQIVAATLASLPSEGA